MLLSSVLLTMDAERGRVGVVTPDLTVDMPVVIEFVSSIEEVVSISSEGIAVLESSVLLLLTMVADEDGVGVVTPDLTVDMPVAIEIVSSIEEVVSISSEGIAVLESSVLLLLTMVADEDGVGVDDSVRELAET